MASSWACRCKNGGVRYRHVSQALDALPFARRSSCSNHLTHSHPSSSTRGLLALTLLATALACQAPRSSNATEIAAIDAAHRAELHAFEAEKERVRSTADLATVRDFGPDGSLYLREVALIGWPQSAYLRVEYTYVNSGKRTRRAPQVTLAVADPIGGVQQSVTQDLILPFAIELGNDSTYSSWLEVPVGDVYRRAGWRWDIRVEPRG